MHKNRHDMAQILAVVQFTHSTEFASDTSIFGCIFMPTIKFIWNVRCTSSNRTTECGEVQWIQLPTIDRINVCSSTSHSIITGKLAFSTIKVYSERTRCVRLIPNASIYINSRINWAPIQYSWFGWAWLLVCVYACCIFFYLSTNYLTPVYNQTVMVFEDFIMCKAIFNASHLMKYIFQEVSRARYDRSNCWLALAQTQHRLNKRTASQPKWSSRVLLHILKIIVMGLLCLLVRICGNKFQP